MLQFFYIQCQCPYSQTVYPLVCVVRFCGVIWVFIVWSIFQDVSVRVQKQVYWVRIALKENRSTQNVRYILGPISLKDLN